MSLADRVDQGVSVVRQIDMVAPAALNQDTTLTDLQTGLTFWTNVRGNFIQDITNLADPAAGVRYFVTTTRNGKEKKRWYSTNLLTTFNGRVRPGFPVIFGAGQVIWVGQQILGALTAQSWLVTLQHDL